MPAKPKPKPKPPKTEAEWCAHRVHLSCGLGRAAINGEVKPPPGTTRTEYALFMALQAIEELSKQITQNQKP